jgi:hypothetical protein
MVFGYSHPYRLLKTMDIDKFVEVFLTGEGLQRMYVYMCGESLGDVMDPASNIACMMASTPITITITEVGIAPFKDRMTHIYPYSKMDQAQIAYIKTIVNDCLDDNIAPSINCSSSIQMGGGCILLVALQQKTARFLKGHFVLTAMCNAICNNMTHSDKSNRIGMCNIIIQRIYASIHLSKDTQRYITEHLNGLQNMVVCPV